MSEAGAATASTTPHRRPPGPGLARSVRQLFSRADPIETLIEHAAEFGPLYRIPTLRGAINVASVELGRKALRDHYPRRIDRQKLFNPFAEQVGADVFAVTGADHERLRSMLQVGYSRHIPAQFVPRTAEAMAEQVRSWPRDRPFSFLDAACDLAARAAAICLTPVDLVPHLRQLAKPANVIMHVQMGQWSWLRLLSPIYRRRWRSATRLLESIASRHREGEFAALPDTWLFDALACAVGPGGERLSVPQMRGAAWFALAGHQLYTGRVATAMLYGLGRDRELHRAVLREVDAAFGDGSIEAPTLRRMPQLRATYLEALRAYPLLPGMAFRIREPVQVAGYELRAGEIFLIDTVSGQYLASSYTNPFEFDAGRCLSDRREHQGRGAFQPFGLPPRACLAGGAVELHAMTLIATVLRNAELRLSRPTWRPRLAMNPLVGPRDGMPVRVEGFRDATAWRAAPRAALESPSFERVAPTDWDSDSLPDLPPREVAAGTEIVRQGEPADAFFVVLAGTASVVQSSRDGRTKTLARLAPGDSFGEIGLLKSAPRSATVVADTPMQLLEVEREPFMSWISGGDLTGRELGSLLVARFVGAALVSALPALDPARIGSAFPEMDLRRYAPGETVLRQGAPATHVYVLVDGELEVVRTDRHDETRRENVIRTGEFFGEIGVLQGRPRSASVRVLGDRPARALCLSADAIQRVMREQPGLREDVLSVMCRRLLKSLEGDSEPPGAAH